MLLNSVESKQRRVNVIKEHHFQWIYNLPVKHWILFVKNMGYNICFKRQNVYF